MGANTAIEWATHTFNPWIGCTRVSPGCDNCYAAVSTPVRALGVAWGAGAARRRTAASTWRQPLAWNRAAAAAGRRDRVFCASLGDWADNAVPIEWLVELLDLVRQADALDWLLLTKRPQMIRRRLQAALDHLAEGVTRDDLVAWLAAWISGYPPRNVWLGTTVENREQMLRRGQSLAAIPARTRFWSAEPLLGPLGEIPPEIMPSWIIAGGESGASARPWSIQWGRSLRDQCQQAGVPFFWKQNGEWRPAGARPSGTEGRFAFGDYEHEPGAATDVAFIGIQLLEQTQDLVRDIKDLGVPGFIVGIDSTRTLERQGLPKLRLRVALEVLEDG